MPVISVINYKGGVGKTTTTANIAAELASRGKRVLLVDVDAQASLTFSFVAPPVWKNELQDSRTIKQIFCIAENHACPVLSDLITYPQRINQIIKLRNNGGRLGLISSHLGLLNVDLELAAELSAANMKQARKKFLKIHRILHDALTVIADSFDVIFIDCPPNFNIVTKNAIVASDFILIPAKPDYLSTLGIDYLIRNLNELKKEHNEHVINSSEDIIIKGIDPQILGVIFTMVTYSSGTTPISAMRQYIAQTQKLNVPTFSAMIRKNDTIFSEAPEYGIPVSCNSYSNFSHKNVITELEALTDEFIQKAGL